MMDDLSAALERRDRVLARVTANAGRWVDDVLAAIKTLAQQNAGAVVTGETVRAMVTPLAGEPHHHNAWGGAIRLLVSRGYLVPTGRWIAMRGEKSNARKTPEYILTNAGGAQ